MRVMLLASALLLAPGPVAAQDADFFEARCRAADLSACNVAGLIYETGAGEDVDLARALDLYGVACVGGDPVGCTGIGLLHQAGRGVERDAEAAAAQFGLGCEQGGQLACDLLTALEQEGPITAPRPFFKSGRVLDGRTGEPLAGALVSVLRVGLQEVTDAEGRVALGQVLEGTYGLSAEILGYEAVAGVLNVPGYAEFVLMLERISGLESEQTGRVGGVILDERDDPVVGVEAHLVGEEDDSVVSNREGQFYLTFVEPGLVTLRLSYPGREPLETRVVVQPGRTTRVDAVVGPDGIEREWPF